MPITGWWCGLHKAAVPLDHFEHCTHVHPDFCAAILADRALQANRDGVRVSGASSCPRKTAISQTENVTVDPLAYLAAMRGTAWHSLMESGCKDRWESKSLAVGAEIPVAGTIACIPITGTIDRVLLRDGKLVGQDHKSGADARVPFIKGGKAYGKVISGNGAPVEYKVQLSLYAELYHQQFSRRWNSAEIVWTFSKDHWLEPIEIMPVDACLAWRPYDCAFTVEQILRQAQSAADGNVKWQDIPLVGKSIHFGTQKVACDWCEHREICWTADSGAPF